MKRQAEAVPDAAASSLHDSSSNTHGKKKVWKWANARKTEKQCKSPKGSMSELKGHYFFTTEDDQNTSHGYYRTIVEDIGRHVHRKEEGSQDLTEFFDYGQMPTLTLPEEPPYPTTRTQEALWNMKLKACAKKQSRLEQNIITMHSIML